MKKSVQQPLVPPGPARSDPPSDAEIAGFKKQVLAFYKKHGRHDMPWRHTKDPYRILVSEIMLQQTQVGRVTEKYPEFLAAFPDFPALARAPQSAVVAAWQGMGYNRRALALKKCAENVVGGYGGTLPPDPAILATLPGIGPATAASICAFAFNLPVVFIETNIRRVFIHAFFPGRDRVDDRELLPLVTRALDKDHPREWYWALMDYGTALKNTVPNPNRRSAAYVKQAPFTGSDREIRGRILKMLVGRNRIARTEILAGLGGDPDRAGRILSALESEGFLAKDRRGYRLKE
ncbi:A/G-specific adenine glycosylase [Methanoregula sp. UBA64]|jgi:A/G-specific adenine glycosylase|uniref:A/G-specific adenine glycosylase n=1 Tax=Methanoregula sp. UBA64 TaxID=1915554 RepID=UPI0025DF9CA3|nr:A/G-specific adenine glycosylase [Methanoregula sp. UBA64]